MGITAHTIRASKNQHRAMLAVTATNNALHVAAGDVVFNGTKYTLAEAQTYTLTARSQKTRVMGYFALKEADQSLVFLVDEFVYDGQDTPFQFGGSGYRELHMLIDATVPANVSDPAASDIAIWYMDDTPVESAASGAQPPPAIPAMGREALSAALQDKLRNLPRS